jgi:hypothetical protein
MLADFAAIQHRLLNTWLLLAVVAVVPAAALVLVQAVVAVLEVIARPQVFQ